MKLAPKYDDVVIDVGGRDLAGYRVDNGLDRSQR